jgi:23S rRNA pseudouridine1911/1915/1917 synthase
LTALRAPLPDAPPPAATDGAMRVVLAAGAVAERFDQALARAVPAHSRSRLQAWIREGRVTLDGRVVADPKRKVVGGESVVVTLPPPASATDEAEDIPLVVVHEDESILVIDKPAGLVVHPGSGNRDGTLLNALLHHAPGVADVPRAGIVHRLDKDTSGLLVVAKTATAQTHLVRQLQARTVKRRYLALVHGSVAADGVVEAPIGRDPAVRTRMAVVARGKPARTFYRVLERFADATLVECSLDTGRTHQIRVHMRSTGHPLVGDPVYGRRTTRGPAALQAFPRQALHATELALVHPVSGATLTWSSPMPADMAELIERLA